MVNLDTIHTAIGIVGNVVAFGVFMSPAPTFYNICKREAVEEFSPNPYLAGVMNCLLWILYGLPVVHPNSILVLIINSIGLFIELCFITIYIYYAPHDKRVWVLKILWIQIVFYALVTGLTLGLAHTHGMRSLIVGIFCTIFGICMYAMPLDIMMLVIRTRSVEYMPFSLSCFSLLNACIWSIYALISFDPFILVSNGVGVLLGIGQLILYASCYRAIPEQGGVEMNRRASV